MAQGGLRLAGCPSSWLLYPSPGALTQAYLKRCPPCLMWSLAQPTPNLPPGSGNSVQWLTHPQPIPECLGSWLHFLLMSTLDGNSDALSTSSLPPMWETGLGSWLLTLPRPSPCCWEFLRSEANHGRVSYSFPQMKITKSFKNQSLPGETRMSLLLHPGKNSWTSQGEGQDPAAAHSPPGLLALGECG